ncbi:MAG: hypothetical protein U9N13_07705 [Euryarchaeota archaeon]|nr:hypothetical protein [Euryarchaeota archaeon]
MTDENTRSGKDLGQAEKRDALHASIGEPHLPDLSSRMDANVLQPMDGIHYQPHKTTGLQSASDMWIDRDRMIEGIHRKEVIEDHLKKVQNFK